MILGNNGTQMVNEGSLNVISKRIFDGTNVRIRQYPFMVSIHRLNKEYTMLCGGVLLSSSVVLTAAHCILDTETNTLFNSTEIKVRVGSKYWLGFGGKEFGALKMIIHDYKGGDDLRNDIGIIHLDQNIDDEFIWSKGIQFAKIFNRNISSKTKAMVLGWGETKSESSSRTILAVNVNISFSEVCKKYPYWSDSNNHTICADPENSQICPGDSGGPLVFSEIERLKNPQKETQKPQKVCIEIKLQEKFLSSKTTPPQIPFK
ncbi:Trypsin epsilon [Smittium culicis]|uniref:Trypsin epsilon n=1 Tax=Smittium culicis TaxID=133412 RepID=A0A1R1YN98_9FUNG|nr:Trypsin epsilon [Smittium culicis]